MTKVLVGLLIAAASLAEGCGPPSLTCQTQPCSSNSGKTYQLCVNIDGSQTWSYGGMQCHAGIGDAAGSQNCSQQIANYCNGTTTGTNPDGGGSSCSIAGTFTNTTSSGATVTMTNTGTSASGTFHLTIVTTSNVTTTIDGNYSVSGNDITMTNTASSPASVMGCIGQAAVYAMTWDASCAHVMLTKVTDACQGRMADANGATLTRQ